MSLSNFPQGIAPQKLFWTVFDSGIVLGSATGFPGRNIKQTVTGTDAITGYVLADFLTATYGAGTVLEIQCVPQYSLADVAAYNVDYTNQIEACASPAYAGGQQLQLQCW